MRQIMEEIEKIIKQELKKRGIRKEDLAKSIGYADSSGLTNALKRGKIRADQLMKIASIFKMDVADFFPGKEERDYLKMPMIDLIRTICRKEIEGYTKEKK